MNWKRPPPSLRALNRNLVNKGETYAPQKISQEFFDEIIKSAKETGGAICGVCPGSGNGNSGGGNGSDALSCEILVQMPLPYPEFLVLKF